MATRQIAKSSSRLSKSTSSSDIQLRISGVPFTLDWEIVASRSAKIDKLLKENPNQDLSHFLRDIPAGPEHFELVLRFCHGLELKISTENVIPLSCLANYLGMTENHSTNNLLKKTLTYFEQRVLPCWNESIKALKASENVLQQAVNLGFVDACAESIIANVLDDPRLLGEPVKNSISDVDHSEVVGNGHRPIAKRRLFVLDWKQEDLITLPLQLYEPIIQVMNQRQVPREYVAASLREYAKKWVFLDGTKEVEDDMLIYEGNFQREVVEAVERLLPHEKGLVPCTFLFEMLKYAMVLEASSDCRKGFEGRIGKQLEQATAKDLLIPSQGYAKEMDQYDVECVKRILKSFYCNYTRSDVSGLVVVAELVEDFLGEVAKNIDLKTSTFISLAEISTSASVGTQRSSDGVYRAIDAYLDKHGYLTESERDDVCRVLDCHKLSPEACQHAAQNERLPLRVVVQVLFVSQLKLRDSIAKEVQSCDEKMRKSDGEAEEEGRVSGSEEEVRVEMERMGSKVVELERECHTLRKEIQSDCSCKRGKEKVSVWREMKRKFGCMSSMQDCNCHVKKKKVHPRR